MEKKKTEFSKVLLKQEAALIWIMSIGFLVLAFYCIYMGFIGSLPWLSAMVGFPWTAYGVSQAMYYRKSMAENTSGGVKYESVISEIEAAKNLYSNVGSDTIDYDTATTTTTYTKTYSADEYEI